MERAKNHFFLLRFFVQGTKQAGYAMNIKRAAIVHTILGVLAIVPAIGLSIGLIIGAGDAGAGVSGNIMAWMSAAFPIILPVSIIVTWIAYVAKRPKIEWVAIAVPWVYLVALITFSFITLVFLARQTPD